MQPLTPALEDLLEHLEDLDRRLGSLRAGEGAAPAGGTCSCSNPILLRSTIRSTR
ncbi:hypothetical protein [Methanoculleus chikugoensis]|uniref:hypothetical protein n=1 Tax=Methanoculleus chikugoensis TaxID=118126 RepID=UPI000B1F071A|nr:hypothetical protein [Methanoculleus chikugoensis]